MRLDLFWMIGELKVNKIGTTDLEAVGKIREAELQVIEDVGGINNPNLARLYRQTVKQTVSREDNAVSLPDGSARVIKASVGDQLYTIVNTDQESVHAQSFMHGHTAVLDGGEVRFLGLEKGKTEAQVIVQRPVSSTIYVEGLRVFRTTRRFSRKGESNPSYLVDSPAYQQFETDSLSGGTLRVAKTGSMAEDYEIARNEFIGRELVYAALPAQSAPVSWIRHAKTAFADFTEEVIKAYPGLADIKPDPEDTQVYPAAIAKTNMPDTLRPLVLILAKYKLTNSAQFHAEYTQAIQRWRTSNAG